MEKDTVLSPESVDSDSYLFKEFYILRVHLRFISSESPTALQGKKKGKAQPQRDALKGGVRRGSAVEDHPFPHGCWARATGAWGLGDVLGRRRCHGEQLGYQPGLGTTSPAQAPEEPPGARPSLPCSVEIKTQKTLR